MLLFKYGLILSVFILSGCSSAPIQYSLYQTKDASSDTKSLKDNVQLSKKDDFYVMIAPKSTNGNLSNKIEYIVEIANKGNKKISFTINDIYVLVDGGVTFGGVLNTEKIAILKAFGYEELRSLAETEKAERERMAMFMAFAAGVNQQQGATALSNMQMATANKTQAISNVEYSEKLSEYAKHAIKNSVINPGKSLGGYFAVESPKEVFDSKRGVIDFTIIVVTGKQEHVFSYALRKST